MSEYFVLIGIIIIIIGFTLKLDVVAVVLVAGLATGIASGKDIVEILNIIGEGFIKNRYMSLFFISLPVIAIMERYGLKEKAADGIKKINGASAGLILWLYLFIRWIAAVFSLRLGGHVQFVRPLILPMAEGAAVKHIDLTETKLEDLKALAGSVENYGNFFGQNIFPLSSGVLLVLTTFKEVGYDVSNTEIAFYSIFTGVAMLILSIIQCYLFEKKLRKTENTLQKGGK